MVELYIQMKLKRYSSNNMNSLKNSLKRGLMGILARIVDDTHRDTFTKKEILCYIDNDEMAAEEALSNWALRGGASLLADFESASPEAIVLRVDLKRLNEIYYEDCAIERAESYRDLSPEEKTEFFNRLDGPKLRAETLQNLEPEERAEALERLDPKLRAEIQDYLNPNQRGESL